MNPAEVESLLSSPSSYDHRYSPGPSDFEDEIKTKDMKENIKLIMTPMEKYWHEKMRCEDEIEFNEIYYKCSNFDWSLSLLFLSFFMRIFLNASILMIVSYHTGRK